MIMTIGSREKKKTQEYAIKDVKKLADIDSLMFAPCSAPREYMIELPCLGFGHTLHSIPVYATGTYPVYISWLRLPR